MVLDVRIRKCGTEFIPEARREWPEPNHVVSIGMLADRAVTLQSISTHVFQKERASYLNSGI